MLLKVFLYFIVYFFELRQSTDFQAQLRLIAESHEIMEVVEWNQKYYGSYAITDLNRNGRLEIIFSHVEGTGRYSYNSIYEVNETFDGITEYMRKEKWTESEADIAEETEVATYYDAVQGRYYYIFSDYLRDGMNCYYQNKRAIYLEENALKSMPLAFEEAYFDLEQDKWICEYTGADRETVIDEDAYDTVEEIFFENLSGTVTKIGWMYNTEDDCFDGTIEERVEMFQKSLQESSFGEK